MKISITKYFESLNCATEKNEIEFFRSQITEDKKQITSKQQQITSKEQQITSKEQQITEDKKLSNAKREEKIIEGLTINFS
jgi:uncharacterized protein involved in exopolysaccharide biosynthesis